MLNVDEDETYHLDYDESWINSGFSMLTKDEAVFMIKLEEHIKERAMKFKEVAEEMLLVSF